MINDVFMSYLMKRNKSGIKLSIPRNLIFTTRKLWTEA